MRLQTLSPQGRRVKQVFRALVPKDTHVVVEELQGSFARVIEVRLPPEVLAVVLERDGDVLAELRSHLHRSYLQGGPRVGLSLVGEVTRARPFRVVRRRRLTRNPLPPPESDPEVWRRRLQELLSRYGARRSVFELRTDAVS